MGTTMEDIQYDEMIKELHYEAVMKNEARKQCIYIFVEGYSEEVSFQPLLEQCGIDFDKNGIIIANYNGIGNLEHAVRLLKKTLSHDRPIIITFDDDLEGKKVKKITDDPLITYFPIPLKPVVKYKNGLQGGSFEESFNPDCFIDACFQKHTIDDQVISKKNEFKKIFEPTKPWISQLANFIKNNGGNPGGVNKINIAENIVSCISEIPETYKKLADTITAVRKKFPIQHPDNISINLRSKNK
ncbi:MULTISPECIES: TOPRIM nucleotidyl transferase/hydrolase domain-containing protein [Enterobacteriaceae]|uniref:TOPRIM nucleotidyl transferase/hydrolase domain-containing protein n=1 Tax=Enterobacteriaceae TaxID=543 RepID=UPI0021D4A974|nr:MULTISPECIES: TOPRIM nucleotidyl transferase/hydrolase domain-containing protein [Enterobacteriaceae]MEC4400307.1 TOPRIM nucleotidyl transferase/hydrolase domain-containing protein [Klebsiella pneumoniae]